MAIIAGGAAQLGGSYFGAQAAQKESERAMEEAAGVRAAALARLQSIDPEQLRELVDLGYLDQLPSLDPKYIEYTPEELQYIEAASPEQYQYLGDVAAEQVQDSPETRAMQMQALADLQQRSEEGLSAADEAGFLSAQRQAANLARGREEAVIQNMRSRGMSGSGLESSLRAQGGQAAAEQLGQIQAERAAANASQRTAALQQMLSGAGAVRGQDINLSGANADILNQMAMENSARRQALLNANVSLRNEAAQAATAEQRRLQDANVGNRNTAQLQNIGTQMQQDLLRQSSRRDDLLRSGQAKNELGRDIFGTGVTKAKSEAGAITGGLPDIYAQGAAKSQREQALYQTLGGLPLSMLETYGTVKQATK